MAEPIPMFLTCPLCSARHIDVGEFATKPHHTHACQHCGLTWRPAVVPTVGVQFLPGFKNHDEPELSVEALSKLEARLAGAYVVFAEEQMIPRRVVLSAVQAMIEETK